MDFAKIPTPPSPLTDLPKQNPPSSRKNLRPHTTIEDSPGNCSTRLPQNSLHSHEELDFLARSESMLSEPKADFLIDNVIFKQEKDFQDQGHCGVCGIDFSDKFGPKVFKKKYCLICGTASCRVCSKRKINGKRVCDLCLLRQRSRNAENRKKDFIAQMQAKILNLKHKIEEGNARKEELKQEAGQVREKTRIDEKEHENGVFALERTLESRKLADSEAFQKLRGLNEEFQQMKRKERTVREDTREISRKTELMRKLLQNVKDSYSQKLQEYQQLKKHQEEIEKSSSFASMIKTKELNASQERKSNELSANKSRLGKKTVAGSGSNKAKMTNDNTDNGLEEGVSYKDRKSSLLYERKPSKTKNNNEVKTQGGVCYPYQC